MRSLIIFLAIFSANFLSIHCSPLSPENPYNPLNPPKPLSSPENPFKNPLKKPLSPENPFKNPLKKPLSPENPFITESSDSSSDSDLYEEINGTLKVAHNTILEDHHESHEKIQTENDFDNDFAKRVKSKKFAVTIYLNLEEPNYHVQILGNPNVQEVKKIMAKFVENKRKEDLYYFLYQGLELRTSNLENLEKGGFSKPDEKFKKELEILEKFYFGDREENLKFENLLLQVEENSTSRNYLKALGILIEQHEKLEHED